MSELDRRRRRKHKIKTRTEAYNNKLEEVSLSGRKRNTHCWRLTAAEGDKGGGGWCLCACVRACEQCSATQRNPTIKKKRGNTAATFYCFSFSFFYFCLILIFTAQSNKELVPACLFSAACTRIRLTSILKLLQVLHNYHNCRFGSVYNGPFIIFFC